MQGTISYFIKLIVVEHSLTGMYTAHIYCNAVTGTGRTRTAFIFELITIVIYLVYLFFILVQFNIPLMIYWTAELLYVFILFILSYWYMKVQFFKRYATKA